MLVELALAAAMWVPQPGVCPTTIGPVAKACCHHRRRFVRPRRVSAPRDRPLLHIAGFGRTGGSAVGLNVTAPLAYVDPLSLRPFANRFGSSLST